MAPSATHPWMCSTLASASGLFGRACGPYRYEDKIIVDCFGESRLHEYRGKHMLDLVVVYGTEAMALAPAPGGRDNAAVVSKAAFQALSLPHPDNNYFLRPDRILGSTFLFVRAGRTAIEFSYCRAVRVLTSCLTCAQHKLRLQMLPLSLTLPRLQVFVFDGDKPPTWWWPCKSARA